MADLRYDLDSSTAQLAIALAVPLWNVDEYQVKVLLDGYQGHQEVSSIRLEAGEQLYTRSKQRDAREPAGYRLLGDSRIFCTKPIVFSGTELGKVTVGLTTRYINEDFVSGLRLMLLLLACLDMVICVCLYQILNRAILRPLKKLDRFAGLVTGGEEDSSGLADERFTGELETLRTSLLAMVKTLNLRLSVQQRAEEDLRLHRNMLSTILDSIPQAVFWKGRDLVYLGANRRFAADAGLTSSDAVVGKSDFNLPWREQAEAYRKDDLDVITHQVSKLHIIESLLKADGGSIWAETSKLPLTDDFGAVYGVVGVYEDITERKRSSDAVERERDRAELYLEVAEVILVAFDTQGRVTLINRKGCEVLGYGSDELIGIEWFASCVPEEERGKVFAVFEKALAGAELDFRHHENHVLARNGERHLISWHNKVLKDKAGQSVGMLSSGEDITDRRKLEEQLIQSQKMESVGRLAGGVAHDFNNMLGVILGAAELGRARVKDDQYLTMLFDQVFKAAERSAAVTRQLLAFSRKQVISPRPVDLNALIEDAESILSRLVSDDVRFTFRPAPGLWTVLIDPSQLDQVLMNLAANASDAMVKGGSLLVETGNVTINGNYSEYHLDAKPGDYVQLTVSDTGIGMNRETREHIFEPFFTTKGIGKGTGLGLATVYGVVTQNGGFINVYSEPGHGTTFRIYLPRQHEAPGAAAPPPYLSPRGTGTILLVEDEEMLLWTTGKLLEELGYTVVPVGTPQEAIILCHKGDRHVDLILTDVIMPGMTGRMMIDEIRAFQPDIEVLYMSGYSADLVVQRGILEAGMHYIAKPLNKESLSLKIDEILS